MKSVIVNFSGHSLCEDTEVILRERYDLLINSEPCDFDFIGDTEQQIEEIISGLSCKIDGTSSLTIIPPGQSTLSILLVCYLHGLIGHFPKICYLELGEVGLYLPKVEYDIDTQKIRTAGRKYRKYIYSA